MRLALFDIDGTLARSVHADDRCFVEALGEVFGLRGFSTDWLEYRYQTDSGLCAEIVRKHLGRDPTEDETARVRGSLLERLQQAVRAEPGAIVAMPGAIALWDRLRQDPRWILAIATGSWLGSARFKLAHAGIETDGIPLATAEDAMDRAEIVRTAIHRAVGQVSNLSPPVGQVSNLSPSVGRIGNGKIVYVGDGVWDLRAARRLGIGFVGVAAGDSRRLCEAGASWVLPDFCDPDRALAALESAAHCADGRPTIGGDHERRSCPEAS